MTEVYVHVHTANTEACRFYETNGFTRDGEVLVGYYTQNRDVPPPKDAYVFRKATGTA